MVALLLKSNEEVGYNSPQSAFYAGMGGFMACCYVFFSFDAVFTESKFQLGAAVAMSFFASGYTFNKFMCPEADIERGSLEDLGCDLGSFWNQVKLPVLVPKCAFSAIVLGLA